jgi:carboxymethylenebutenolidase
VPSLQRITFPVDGRETLPAALAVPDGDTPASAVIVIHEMLGLNDDIRRICLRFADAGYVALAPDFLAGLGPRPVCMIRLLRGLAAGEHGRPQRRIEAARDWISERPEVAGPRVGVVGFCFGGGFALLYAAARGRAAGRRDGPALAAVAPFYAAVPKDESQLDGICPTVASYGRRDRVFGRDGDRLERILEERGVAHDVKTYPEAGHSFMNQLTGLARLLGPVTPMRAGYVDSAAEDAWARMLAFFARHLRPVESAAGHHR